MVALRAPLGESHGGACHRDLGLGSEYPGQNGSCCGQIAFLLFFPLYAAEGGIVREALTSEPVLSKLNRKDILWNECDGA